jgi:hypothetical protein
MGGYGNNGIGIWNSAARKLTLKEKNTIFCDVTPCSLIPVYVRVRSSTLILERRARTNTERNILTQSGNCVRKGKFVKRPINGG